MEDNIRKSLVIKPVTPQDLEQFNDLLTYLDCIIKVTTQKM